MLRNLRNLKRNSIHTLYRYSPKSVLSNKDFTYYLFRITPLYAPQNKMVVFWNGKAGCSFISKWFFFQSGLLEEALKYNPWIHDYRNQIFTKKDNYIPNLSNALFDESVAKLKIVRNPYARAVSSYFAVNTYFENNRKFDYFHKTERQKIFAFLGRNENNGFSFNEFVDFLINDDSIDTHFIKQTHQLEKTKVFKFHRIIKLEKISEELDTLESELNLKSSSHLNFRKSNHNVSYVKGSHSFCGNTIFSFYRSKDLTIPHYQYFYNSAIQEKVFQLYQEDFINYEYSKDINN